MPDRPTTPRLRPMCRRHHLRAASALAAAILVAALASRAASASYAPGIVLVRLDASARPTEGDVFARLGLSAPRQVIALRPGAMRPARGPLSGWWAYRLDDGRDPAAVADSLARRGIVAQPNYLYRFLDTTWPTQSSWPTQSATQPNDPRWADQWALQKIRLDAVWERVRAQSRDSVIVGIIDSGVDYLHPDLAPRIWINAIEAAGLPGVDDDRNGYVDDIRGWDFTDAPELPGKGDYVVRDNDPMDESGHGTNVAGVVAAAIDNGIGVAGVAPTARIMVLRAGADLAFGGGFLEDDDIAAATVYAVENGAKVINVSFGDVVSSPLMHDVVRYADAAGVVVAAAAGNENSPSLLYPAAYDETIAVGATTKDDARASFSSWGENLDLVAPGYDILATAIGGGYARASGTSFAAPHVAGACAIVLGLAPGMTPVEVRTLLRAGVVDLGPPGWDAESGAGRLDLPTLLAATTSPTAEILGPRRPAGADTAFAWSALVGGAPPVAWSLTLGLGATPRVWTAVATGTLDSQADTLAGRLATMALADSDYALRLVATDALGRTCEDRTIVAVDHSPPRFVLAPTPRYRWSDAQQDVYLEWETDDLTAGTIAVWHGAAADGPPTEVLPVGEESRDHLEVLLPGLNGGAPFTVQVRASNRAGLAAESAPTQVTPLPYPAPVGTFERIAALPSGIAMPGTSDFDRDGRPEIAVKLATRAAYDTVNFYELAPTGRPTHAFQCPVPMRPAAAGDLDGNGLLDLVGFDHPNDSFRVIVVEQATQAAPPTIVRCQRASLVGPTVGDADGDGRLELIALDDNGRGRMRVFEAPGPGRLGELAQVAELVSPGGEFGISRAVADLDGNGRPSIIAGTGSGTIVVFRSTGDNAFAPPLVIPGTDDATRVWGGIDLTGDRREDFVVLRLVQSSKFTPDQSYFRLEVYSVATPGATPAVAARYEFADPRADGNGFAVGPLGPLGEGALVVAAPPRIYAIAPSVPDVGGVLWYGEAGSLCQPVVADLDEAGGSELVCQAPDSIVILRRRPATAPPLAPANVAARARDSVSVEVTWDLVPGLAYRLWVGPDEEHLAPKDVPDPALPIVVGGLPDGQPVLVAVQAINRAQADSLGPLSGLMSVVPHPGPRAVAPARVVASDIVIAEFDLPLAPQETSVGSFALTGAADPIMPSSAILDHDGRRVVLTFAGVTVDPMAMGLRASLRDTAGALRTATVPLVAAPEAAATGIAYALATGATMVEVGFASPIATDGLVGASIALVGGPAVAEATRRDARTATLHLAASLASGSTYVLVVSGAKAADGHRFNAAAILSGRSLGPADPVEIVAILQPAPDSLWVVTTQPLAIDRMTLADASILPRLRVAGLAPGPISTVLIVTLDPATPAGPWEDEYRLSLVARLPEGGTRALQAAWRPLAARPYTGRLRRVLVLGRTQVRLAFDVPIAATGQPSAAIRVEPRLQITGIAARDSVVDVTLSDVTPLGPWGITYFVHVDGLVTTDGQPLTELFAFTVPGPAGIDSIAVFPQPYPAGTGRPLIFGGLPPGGDVKVYALDGTLVRRLANDGSGGVAWDGKTEGGRVVAAGVYLYVVESPVGRRTGKIAVVR